MRSFPNRKYLSFVALSFVWWLPGCVEDVGDPSGASGGSCTEGSVGTIVVETTGLPVDANAAVKLIGPSGERPLTNNETWNEADTGDYSVTAEAVAVDDPIVRSIYVPTVAEESFCLGAGASHTIRVTYAPIPSSNKLWGTNASDAELMGFDAASLGATGAVDASVAADINVGGDIAFDREGNAWTFGSTTTDAMIARIPAASLGASGEKEPDREINLAGVGCLPAVTALAFDAEGNLWVSSGCSDNVVRLSPDQLAASGDVTPEVVLSNIGGPGAVAFDASGNLYVTEYDSRRILRYDAASLAMSSDAPDGRILVTPDIMNTSGVAASWLAFATDGSLWVNDFGGNAIFPVAADMLTAAGDSTVVPAVQIHIGIQALIHGMAFDESGGLWFAHGQGELGRLSPAQLTMSSGPGDPTYPDTVITGNEAGSFGNVALFPAPAGLPLYHSYAQ